jgi:hypothetical protein
MLKIPFIQHSAQIAPKPKSLLCSQFIHCPYSETNDSLFRPHTHIFRIYSNNFQQSKNVVDDLPHSGFLARGLMNTPTLIYLSQLLHISASWFSTLIINDCTYYGAILYAIFSSSPLYAHICRQIQQK